MGFLSRFTKPAPTLLRLRSGSFTVDREGTVVVGTLPSSFPAALVKDIAGQVLAAFREGAEAQLPLSEIVINYPGLRIAARDLRGGALIFLSAKEACSPASPA
ncbi:MAG TPA: hypothetical protein VMU04_23830 [Candidatus Acidoferrum sp.]|nr:hypothetical protein [Candidatus Acidoferrum sp.]